MSEKHEKSEKQSSRVARWDPFAELEGFERWTPFRELAAPHGRLARLLEGVLGEAPRLPRAFAPAVDIHEDEKQYTVTVELPGGKKDDVQVEIEEGVLSIHGEKKSEREEKKEQRRWVERSYGSFTRSFTLPANADAERVDASFKEGVLTLVIPKTEVAKPRAIAIK
jgi:HSP20 family protein